MPADRNAAFEGNASHIEFSQSITTRIRTALGGLALALGFALSMSAMADNSPLPSIAPFPGAGGVHRPVAAVGKRFIYAMDADDYMVYRRDATGAPNTTTLAIPYTQLENVFSAQMTKLNNKVFPASTGISCNVHTPGVSVQPPTGGTLPLNQVGCIMRPYDDDVYYDKQTGRFWIMAKLRPNIGACTTSDGKAGYSTAHDTACHTASASTLKKLLKRYIVLAVSRPGAASSDAEDPANGFYTYTLTDKYGDWSQLMVHNGMVLLNYRDFGATGNDLWVFGAHDLMGGGVIPNHAFLPQPSAHFTAKDFNIKAVDWVHQKSVDVQLNTSIMFVKQQSDSKVTYLVAANGSQLVVYGLTQTLGSTGQMPAPTIIMPAVVDLPNVYPKETVPAAYANGFLYWTLPVKDGSRLFLRTMRWEVHHAGHTWNGVHPIFISNSASSKYLQADIGVGDTPRNYHLPATDVTPSGDILTMYHTFPTTGSIVVDVHYAVIPAGKTGYSHSRIICTGSGAGNSSNPYAGGVYDIVSVVPDPKVPGQMFMSSACTKGTGYQPVIAAVKP